MKTLLWASVAGILLIFLDVKANEEGPLQKIYSFIFWVGMIVFVFCAVLAHNGCFDAENKQNYSYKAIQDGEVKKFSKCYSSNKYNICSADSDNEVVVDAYWKED